jgi:hypothetical protein
VASVILMRHVHPVVHTPLPVLMVHVVLLDKGLFAMSEGIK